MPDPLADPGGRGWRAPPTRNSSSRRGSRGSRRGRWGCHKWGIRRVSSIPPLGEDQVENDALGLFSVEVGAVQVLSDRVHDLVVGRRRVFSGAPWACCPYPRSGRARGVAGRPVSGRRSPAPARCLTKLRSEEHTSELQSRGHLVCRLLLEKKKVK